MKLQADHWQQLLLIHFSVPFVLRIRMTFYKHLFLHNVFYHKIVFYKILFGKNPGACQSLELDSLAVDVCAPRTVAASS